MFAMGPCFLNKSSSIESTDLYTWVNKGTSANQHTYSVCVNKGVIAIGGSNGSLAVSRDNGTTWTQYTICATWKVSGICYYDGAWYFASDARSGASVWTSSDDFVSTKLPSAPSGGVGDIRQSVFNANGILFYSHDKESSTAFISHTSSPGLAWTTVNFSTYYGSITGCTYINGWYIFITTNGYILRSSDLINFSVAISGVSTYLTNICQLNGVVIASNASDSYFVSMDSGETWTQNTGLSCIISTSTMFIGITSNMGVVKTSNDSVTWTTRLTQNLIYNTVACGSADGALASFASFATQGYVQATIGTP